MKTILYLFLITLISFGCTSSKDTAQKRSPKPKVQKIDKMDFHHNEKTTLTQVVDHAIAGNKLVFVDIYTDWCTPCKLMDQDVFSDDEMTKYMKANFVNYKVDGEKHNGPNLGVMYGVAGFPTLLILDQKGRVLERHDGALYQSGLRDMAARALSKASL
ncbi:thioredoxin family protein [Portibacter lacus]|nr:thioredoxin family protein [Portibacter lacus]